MQKTLHYLIENLQLFAEDGDQIPPPGDDKPGEPGAEDYIESIKQLKANSVPKEDFEKLKKENKSLLSALIDGKVTPDVEKALDMQREPGPDVNKLREKLFSPDANLSNLEFVKTTLELRKALMEKDGPEADIFLGKFDPSIARSPAEMAEEMQLADDTAKKLQEVVDASNGDPSLFQGLLQGVLVDDSAVLMAVQKRKNEAMKQRRRK